MFVFQSQKTLHVEDATRTQQDHANFFFFSNFLHIPGLNVIQTTGLKFRFTPARMHRHVLVEGSVLVNNGIKIRLSCLAMTQQAIFPKGCYLGRSHVQTDFHVNSYYRIFQAEHNAYLRFRHVIQH